MEALDAIETRRSTRSFRPDPIPAELLDRILAAAARSPSYTNTQPWEVVAVSGRKRDALAARLVALASANAPVHPDLPSPPPWPAAIAARSGDHGARRLAALGVARDDTAGRERLRLMNYEFYGAPCVLFLFIDGSLGEWSILDMGIFSQNLILAAHALGVGSCLQASVTGYAPVIKEFLGIPAEKKLVIGIALGYTDGDARLNTYRSIKRKADEFTHHCE